MRRKSVRLLLGLLVILIAIQLVPVKRANPAVNPASELEASVAAVFRRACYDCHSNRTHWPWYSRVAPISWLVAHDVSEGRGRLNLSLWAEYPAAKQSRLAAEIADEVDSGGMPLPMYLRLHPNARLGPSDREQIRVWAGSLSATPARGESESR